MQEKDKILNNEQSSKIIKLPYVITLKYPVGRGSELISELVIERRLKAKDFKGIQANNITFDDMLRLLSRLTAQPLSVIEELDSIDLYEAIEVLSSFLPSGLKTGDSL